MKIAVTAASGQLGNAIVQELKRGLKPEEIIAIARSKDKAQGLGVEIRQGDYNQRSQFTEALKDVDVLLLVSGNDEPEKRKRQHADVIDAAKEAGVRKVVYVSVLGPEENSQFSPIVNSNRYTEEYLKKSGLDWSIGRNGIYIEPDLDCIEEYKKSGKIINCAGESRCAYTTRSELALAYTGMLTENRHNSQTYNLTGEAISQSQLADLINFAFGTSLTYEAISIEQYQNERTEALGQYIGKVVSGIYQGIRDGAFDVQSHFAKAAGRPHVSWGEYFNKLKTIK